MTEQQSSTSVKDKASTLNLGAVMPAITVSVTWGQASPGTET